MKRNLILVSICLFIIISCKKTSTMPDDNQATTVSSYSKVTLTGTAKLSLARIQMASVGLGNKVVFAGGFTNSLTNNGIGIVDNVDIYDISADKWSTAKLSEARRYISAAAAGTKMVFAGGADYRGQASATVDIYDINTNAWSSAKLSVARFGISAAAIGNKIYLIGGNAGTLVIDIYDTVTNTWSSISNGVYLFSQLNTGAIGNKIIFAGGNETGLSGISSPFYYIFDTETNTWKSGKLSMTRSYSSSAVSLNKMVVVGNMANNNANTAEIYDATTDSWSTVQLNTPRTSSASAACANIMMFAGGIYQTNNSRYQNSIDVFNAGTGQWSTSALSVARGQASGASAGNKVVFAGGMDDFNYSAQVDIFTLSN